MTALIRHLFLIVSSEADVRGKTLPIEKLLTDSVVGEDGGRQWGGLDWQGKLANAGRKGSMGRWSAAGSLRTCC
jgi:hypothetical protein